MKKKPAGSPLTRPEGPTIGELSDAAVKAGQRIGIKLEPIVPPSEYPKPGSSSEGTMDGYSVEARSGVDRPIVVSGQTFDTKWRRVAFSSSTKAGVPRGSEYEVPMLEMAGLLGYATAQSLRWWLHAEADRDFGLGLDTRIVKHKIKYHWSEEAVSDHFRIHGENRSNIMPDWGKK